jgi:hypothetical protein
MTMPLCMMRQEFASSWLRNPLQKWTIYLIHLRFLALSKTKKNDLKGQTFVDIKRNMTILRGIPENDLQDCFWQWHHHLTKCTASQGEHFEGDSSH